MQEDVREVVFVNIDGVPPERVDAHVERARLNFGLHCPEAAKNIEIRGASREQIARRSSARWINNSASKFVDPPHATAAQGGVAEDKPPPWYCLPAGAVVEDPYSLSAALGLTLAEGHAIKYLWRGGKKPGESKLKSLKNARHALTREIIRLEREENQNG